MVNFAFFTAGNFGACIYMP